MSEWVLLGLLTFTALYDFRRREIPNYIPLLLTLLGTARIFIGELSLSSALLGFVLLGGGFLCLGLTKKAEIGGGDIKLAAGLGCAMGLGGAYLVLLAAAVMLAVFSLLPFVKSKTIPFAPFVLMGYLLTQLLKYVRY